MAKTIVGLYDDRTTATRVLSELEAAGFGEDHLGFASGDDGEATRYDMDEVSSSTLAGYGVADEEARFYAEGVRRGGSVVIARVHDSNVDSAVDVMARHNPVRYEDRSAEYLADYDASASAYSAAERTENRDRYADQAQERLQEIEEHLKIGKREVVGGGVRVHKYVDTNVEEETLRLREEHIEVDRTDVNRELTADEADALFEEKTIEMVERSEEAVVEKTATVTGEVAIGKDVNVREETVGGEVRSTRVEVERFAGEGADDFRSHYDTTFKASGRSYDEYEPAYTFGQDAAKTYGGRDYSAVEADLRADYASRNGGDDSLWDDMKDAVQHGFNKARAAV